MDIYKIEGQVRSLNNTLESGNIVISGWGTAVIRERDSSTSLNSLVSKAFSIHKYIKANNTDQVDQEALGRVNNSLKTLANRINTAYGKADIKERSILQTILSFIFSLFLTNPRSNLESYVRTISGMQGKAFVNDLKRKTQKEPLIPPSNTKEIRTHYKAMGYTLQKISR